MFPAVIGKKKNWRKLWEKFGNVPKKTRQLQKLKLITIRLVRPENHWASWDLKIIGGITFILRIK